MDGLIDWLNEKVQLYNNPEFIAADPICIPHAYNLLQDKEISGLFAALFAWGNRTNIINKSKALMHLMDNAPYDFVLNHQATDLKTLLHFKHRTFNADDLLYFIAFLHKHYTQHYSLETAFSQGMTDTDENIEQGLIGFKNYFFADEHLKRTEKHVSSPQQNSACKRLSMYLRWMVRKDNKGVDFGLWQSIKPSQLICPIDVHVARVAKRLGLLTRNIVDWQAAIELTNKLKVIDASDPVQYDFALFGLGVMEKY